MARTYRRKNFELVENSSWSKEGSKIALYYTVEERVGPYGLNTIYREPTKTELYKKKKYAHGESSSSNAYSPSREYRQYRENELRQLTKRELLKFVLIEGYEPMVPASPQSHLWDWR